MNRNKTYLVVINLLEPYPEAVSTRSPSRVVNRLPTHTAPHARRTVNRTPMQADGLAILMFKLMILWGVIQFGLQ
jgi:hypothetical protein